MSQVEATRCSLCVESVVQAAWVDWRSCNESLRSQDQFNLLDCEIECSAGVGCAAIFWALLQSLSNWLIREERKTKQTKNQLTRDSWDEREFLSLFFRLFQWACLQRVRRSCESVLCWKEVIASSDDEISVDVISPVKQFCRVVISKHEIIFLSLGKMQDMARKSVWLNFIQQVQEMCCWLISVSPRLQLGSQCDCVFVFALRYVRDGKSSSRFVFVHKLARRSIVMTD